MIRHRDVVAWAQPWPIRFKTAKGLWRIRLVTLSQALAFKAFWRDDGGRRVTARTAARRIRKNWLGKDHQIASLARVGAVHYRPVLLVEKGIIVDGNHTLLALERLRYRGRILVLER